MYKAHFILWIAVVGVMFAGLWNGSVYNPAAAMQDEETKQSRPLGASGFSGLAGPISDPAYDSVYEEPQRAEAGELDFQPLGECNTCMGSNLVPSYAETPERMRGLWAYPDCSETTDILILKKHFSLWSGGANQICLEPVIEAQDLGYFYSFVTKTGETFVNVTNDGLMQTALPKETGAAFKQKIKDRQLEIEEAASAMAREYAACGFFPVEESEFMIWIRSFLDDLDRFVAECAPQGHNDTVSTEERRACQRVLFAEFDADNDGLLDFQELGDALFKALIAHDMMSTCISSLSFRRTSQEALLDYTNMMIETLDRNEDFHLSQDELLVLDEHLQEIFDLRGMAAYYGLQDLFPFAFAPRKIDREKLEAIKSKSE